ncbi:MAG: radical SAM protein, partial [Sedimentisphaerales bacterium]|nr:radical SAM protein [Sedimentisphaerales bacterium]
LVMSGVTDCFQPIERKLKITRQCLEVCQEFKNPVAIITKNHLVTRDIDIFKEMAKWNGCAVSISVTTLRRDLANVMEPRASRPEDRLRTIRELSAAGIPVGVMVAPIIPALTDEEVPALLKAVKDAGAQWAGYTVMRLPYAVKDLFVDWLTRNFPDRKDKIIHRIEALRGGKLNDSNFGSRMRGEGIFAEQIKALFLAGSKKIGFKNQWASLDVSRFEKPGEKQLELF